MPANPVSARETVERFLTAVTGPRFEDTADFYAEKFVIEAPFTLSFLFPRRNETTREELRARFRASAADRRYTRVENARIHETTDPEVVVLEYDLHGEAVKTGDPFVLTFVMVVTVRDGEIVHSRDYSDPIVGARLFGLVPALVAELTGTTP